MNLKVGIFVVVVFTHVHISSSAVTNDGAVARAGVTADQLLTQQPAGNFSELQRLVNLYAPFASINPQQITAEIAKQPSSFYSTLLRDASYLLEGFFLQCALMLELPLFAGIDTTNSQTINPHLFFDVGLVVPQSVTATSLSTSLLTDAPPVPVNNQTSSIAQVVTLPQLCAYLFQASRYMRSITQSSNTSNAITLLPADLCVGVIVINNGWVCSLTMPSLNAAQVQQKSGLFCLPAGLSVQTSNGNILGFVNNHTIQFVPFAPGVDQWESYNKGRTAKLVVANDVGSTAFVASQLGNGVQSVTCTITPLGDISIQDAQGSPLTQIDAQTTLAPFYKNLTGPWAVILEMDNGEFSKGDLFPTFQVKGVVKLNYLDFPLQFQASQSQQIGLPFSFAGLINAPQTLLEQTYFLSRYTQSSIETNFLYGACKDYTISINLPIYKKNNLSIAPLNSAYAKVKGAMQYDWETQKFTMEQALQGISTIMNSCFFTKRLLTPGYMMHHLKNDPNVLLI